MTTMKLQTVLVSRKIAPTRKKAAAILRRHGWKTYTSRATARYWRFRQRPPSCFGKRYASVPIRKGEIILVFSHLRPGCRKKDACR